METESNLVFYIQSIITVISGRASERAKERERENWNSKTLFYNDCSLG